MVFLASFDGGHGCPGAAVLPCGALVVGWMTGPGALDAPLACGGLGFALSGHWRALRALFLARKSKNIDFSTLRLHLSPLVPSVRGSGVVSWWFWVFLTVILLILAVSEHWEAIY